MVSRVAELELRHRALEEKLRFEDSRIVRKEISNLSSQKEQQEQLIQGLDKEIAALQSQTKFAQEKRNNARLELVCVGRPELEQLEQTKQLASAWDMQTLSKTLSEEVRLLESLKQEAAESEKDRLEMKKKHTKIGQELETHYEARVRNMETYISDLALKLQSLQLEMLKSKYAT